MRVIAVVLLISLCGSAQGANDKAQSPIDVYEWSLWVGNPAQPSLNAARVYKNALPSVVGTSRPKIEEKDVAGRFPIAPLSVVQFFGEPCRDIDIDVRMKKGTLLAHWPPSTERGGRLQWFGSDLLAEPPADIPPSYLPETHWLHKLRTFQPALVLKHESHFDRFLAYDTELALPVPLRIRGGPDEYTLQNLTGHRLRDLAIITPTGAGFRVGWLDELPTASAEKPTEPTPKKTAAKLESVFDEPESKPKEEPIPSLPPEGDANVKARVDQLLNRPITVAVEQAPRREVIDLIMGEARLRYELDDRTLAKAEVNLGQPMSAKAAETAARDVLADVLGELGLSYRVTSEGKLFITTAARLADEVGKKGGVIEGPPVKLLMSQPLKAADPSYREETRATLARRLAGQGLREDVVRFILSEFGPSLFEPTELIILVHMSRESIDEAVLLDVFPPPRKLVRTALLVVHGVDPRLQDHARTLVQELGAESSKARDAAEAKLQTMGAAAVPVLEEALSEKDVEIVFRAERLLLRLNRAVP